MESPRLRSAGVTAAATFAILGCAMVFTVWAYILVNLIDTTVDQQGHYLYETHLKTFFLMATVPPMLIAAGVRTAIGLFQLRPWARVGAMAWAVLALVVSLWLIAFRPFETFVIPEHFVSQVESISQLFAIASVFMLFPVSIWWLYLFRLKSVRLQFSQGRMEEQKKQGERCHTGTIDVPKAVI
jgi:hypothetical protein